MDLKQKLIMLERKAQLSTLWIFVLLNIIFRDIHELFRPGLLDEMLSGVVNGVQMTEPTLLVAGILLELPIAMVILSRVLPLRVNRWANIIIAPLTIVATLANGLNDLDDIWFISVAIIGLVTIVWQAWRWPRPATNPELSLTLESTGD
jgi:hypothetical protein